MKTIPFPAVAVLGLFVTACSTDPPATPAVPANPSKPKTTHQAASTAAVRKSGGTPTAKAPAKITTKAGVTEKKKEPPPPPSYPKPAPIEVKPVPPGTSPLDR